MLINMHKIYTLLVVDKLCGENHQSASNSPNVIRRVLLKYQLHGEWYFEFPSAL